MKILIADSGSTKCDWALTDEKGNRFGIFQTRGLNPYFHDPDFIEKELNNNADLSAIATEIQHVYFYGAGSSTIEMCRIMEEGLRRFFPHAELLIDHDLVGSAYATYDGEPCMACILGTGSNSCYFDGNEVTQDVPSLAYILGDESSGSWYGKILLREYFYHLLPEDLKTAFEASYSPSKEEIIDRVYRQPHANVYLAGFMKFIGEHKDHPHVRNWVVSGMVHFIEMHVKTFSVWRDVKVHFVGSIGQVFEPCLREAAERTGIQLGKIIRKPIDALVDYHVRYKFHELVSK
jgi:N-acetylglucosamine kinase-like BadF-type ATPase